jgi:hypothetical protein
MDVSPSVVVRVYHLPIRPLFVITLVLLDSYIHTRGPRIAATNAGPGPICWLTLRHNHGLRIQWAGLILGLRSIIGHALDRLVLVRCLERSRLCARL